MAVCNLNTTSHWLMLAIEAEKVFSLQVILVVPLKMDP